MATTGKIGDVFGWTNNPIYKNLASNKNALMSFGAGLASGNSWSDGLANGVGAIPIGAARDDAYALMQEDKAKQAEALNQTTEWLRANGKDALYAAVQSGAMAPSQAWQIALDEDAASRQGVKPIEINGQLVNPATGEVMGDYRDQVGQAGSTEFGLTPIWGQLPDGTFGYGVQGKDGTFRQVDTGNLNPLDPRTLAGERAYGTALGGAQGGAVGGAAGDISNAETALDLISQIKTDPELPWATGRGAAMGMNNPIVNPQRFAFQNLVEQAKSGAFLTAIQDMKGLGALSNTEGTAATAAITRMNTALEKDDFLKAVDDYEKIIRRAKERAEGRVGMQPNLNTPTAPASGSIDSLVDKYR